jgi:hypothetical protein
MASLANHRHIEMVQRPSLRPNPKNPRKHSEASLERLARSLDRFGFIDPIIADDEGLIVAGHGRWLAAGLRGIEEVPVTGFASSAKKIVGPMRSRRTGWRSCPSGMRSCSPPNSSSCSSKVTISG